jgi:hypothetical protein
LNLLNLQLLCFGRLAEKLVEHSASLAGQCTSPTDFFKRLSSDSSLMQIYASICGHRADVARHFLTLFINTCKRRRIKTSKEGLESQNWSMPFVHLCSSIIMAADSMVEEIAGRIVLGHLPHKSIRDHLMEMDEIILGNVHDCLSTMSKHVNTAAGQKLPRARQAIPDGNIPALSAELINMLLRTLESWNAAVNPLVSLDSSSLVTNTCNNLTNQNKSLLCDNDEMDLQLDKLTPEGFENLFREFLSTPLELFPMATRHN